MYILKTRGIIRLCVEVAITAHMWWTRLWWRSMIVEQDMTAIIGTEPKITLDGVSVIKHPQNAGLVGIGILKI